MLICDAYNQLILSRSVAPSVQQVAPGYAMLVVGGGEQSGPRMLLWPHEQFKAKCKSCAGLGNGGSPDYFPLPAARTNAAAVAEAHT